MDNTGNGWDKYQLLVLDKLDSLEKGQVQQHEKVAALATSLAVLNNTLRRDTTWIGVLSGFVTFVITSIAAFFLTKR